MALTEQQIVAMRRWAEAVATGISPYQHERIAIMCEELLTVRTERDALRATVARLERRYQRAISEGWALRDRLREANVTAESWKSFSATLEDLLANPLTDAAPTATPAPDGRRDTETET